MPNCIFLDSEFSAGNQPSQTTKTYQRGLLVHFYGDWSLLDTSTAILLFMVIRNT
jgi:hypothetical protein